MVVKSNLHTRKSFTELICTMGYIVSCSRQEYYIRSTPKLSLAFVILKEFSYRCLTSGDKFATCLEFE